MRSSLLSGYAQNAIHCDAVPTMIRLDSERLPLPESVVGLFIAQLLLDKK